MPILQEVDDGHRAFYYDSDAARDTFTLANRH